jgi:hypothetical protein
MRDVFICDAVRTPIGRFGGSLAKVRADDLAATPIKALMAKHPNLDWSQVDEVFFGCANRPARITATSPAWRCCWRAFRNRFPARLSIASVRRASMRSAPRAGRFDQAKSISRLPAASNP